MSTSALKLAATQATDWLYGAAVPLWLERGVDWGRGGYCESLSLIDARSTAEFRRLRVLTRQIFVFAEAASQGVRDADKAVDLGLKSLETFRHAEGGYVSRVDLDGRPIDMGRDLYDLAFALFALAHAYRLTKDEAVRRQALNLTAFICHTMRHSAGGFVEAVPAPAYALRRQNPHMHLLEAALAALEYMGGVDFSNLIDDLVALFQDRFFDRTRGVVHEYFKDDLREVERKNGLAETEPGHHMEWAWLLEEVVRVRGIRIAGGDDLALFALKHGLDTKTGMLYGTVFDDGTVGQPSVRLWPHGEWLKAALRVPAIESSWPQAWTALSSFLNVSQRGLWYESWTQEGFVEAAAPASSLYHITTAVIALRDAASGNV